MTGPDNVLRWTAGAATGLALTSAAVTAYWLGGGTVLLDTVGGYPERVARSRSQAAVLLALLVVAVKVCGGLVAVGLAGQGPARRLGHRSLLTVSGLGSVVLVGYGGLLVVVGGLVLAGALHPDGAVDRRVLTWHVLLWDLWFLLWGLALGGAAVRAARPAPPWRRWR